MENTKTCEQSRVIKGTYSCDNFADVYIGDCNGVRTKIANSSTLEAVNFEEKTNCNEYLYFVCWSDDGVLNGLLAELYGTNTILSGTHSKWQVYPTKIDFDSASKRPSDTLVNQELKKAHCKKWKAVTEGPNNDGSVFRNYKDIDKNAYFIWFDSGKDTRTSNVPFRGFNHDEFLIFRFPVSELFKEECHDCKHECECQDDCNCSVCATEITEQQEALKTEALRKSFVINGKENNSRRCKTPYSAETCSTLDLPKIEPCFYLHWGDGPKDQMETHDDEVMYITACNPYGNLSFKGLTVTSISIIPTPTFGNDGTKTIQIVPDKLICLGDLCGCTCVSQALSLLIRSAKPQNYEIHVEYCIDQIVINQDNKGKTRFPITLIKS